MKTILHSNSLPRRARYPNRARILVSYTVWVLFSVACLLAMPAVAVDEDFDHFTTGFPLSGAHKRVDCESCHQRGVFQGTPSQCNACHNGRTAPGIGNKHIQAANTCDDCHTTFSWDTNAVDHSSVMGTCTSCHQLPIKHFPTNSMCDNCHNTLSWTARVNHGEVTQPCANCHNGTIATGMHGKHISTTAGCETCHTTRSWRPNVDHGLITETCFTCHNNINAEGKNNAHVDSSNVCDQCHNTRTWEGATFDHNNVVPGTCNQCHTKPVNHIPSSEVCDDCHSTVSWKGAANHDNVVPGTCITCHDGITATGKSNQHIATNNLCDGCHKNFNSFLGVVMNTSAHDNVLGTCATCHQKDLPNNHWPVTDDCSVCHRTSGWGSVPITAYSHKSAAYPGRHKSSVTCIRCHAMNGSSFDPASRWSDLIYKPDCAGCHAGNFRRQGEHIGGVNGTVSQNRDCGASGCHRVSAGGF